jgi:hypothetical protein
MPQTETSPDLEWYPLPDLGNIERLRHFTHRTDAEFSPVFWWRVWDGARWTEQIGPGDPRPFLSAAVRPCHSRKAA